MKNICYYVLLILAVFQTAIAQQTNSQNYLVTKTFRQAGANENDVSQVTLQVEYFDGLGRPVQNVGVKQGPSGSDLVQPIEYDNLGRKAKEYLPYAAAGNGAFQANATTAINGWYATNSTGLQKLAANDLDRPFMETFFEESLHRQTGQRAPGNRSVSSSVQYFANAANEIKRYDYNPGNNTITQNGNYAAATLTRIQSADEQGIISNQYADKAGQMVCRYDPGSGYTYYVYDNLGLLRGVLQPKFQDDANFANFAFLYDYDARNRIVRKQIPGAGAVEIVYDQFDRPALSRDANQAARGVWGFTKYDALNRPVVTGEIVSSDSRVTWATNINTGAQHHESRNNAVVAGYTLDNTAPKTATEGNILTITFYDDYAFSKPAGLSYTATYYPASNLAIKGLQTGGRTRMLPGNGAAGGFRTSVTYYDAEYRPLQTVRELYDLGATAFERVSTKYKFDLAPVIAEQKTEQVLSGAITNTHLATYSYDHADRLLSVKEKVTVGNKTKEAFTLAQRYNVLGQLRNKWLHSKDGTNFRRRTDYTYNIRGWETDAKTVHKKYGDASDSFFFAIHTSHRNNAGYSNGSIDSLLWKNKNEAAFTAGLKFSYDAAGRLSGSTGLFNYANTEAGITYDKNGNLTALKRAGAAVDNLTYSYTGNQLSAVSDASGSNLGVKNGASGYSYDGNGNMTNDGNRGALITYNYLNLPKTVTIGANPAFTYDYDASGSKHKYVNTSDAFTAKYAGIFQYDGTNTLKRSATSEGQVILTPDSLRFEYYLKDHLGNVRIVFDEKGDVVQNTEYYPFGLAIAKDGKTAAERNSINRFLYNEKELQPGSGYLDYGARMYMPELGRWGTGDPLSELSRRFSPYVYGYNNPLRFIDPDGRFPDEPRKGLLQRVLDYFGFFNKPESKEEAIAFSNRQERFNETATLLQRGSDELKSKAEWVPILGGITDISQGAVKKDNKQVVLGMASLAADAVGGAAQGAGFDAVSAFKNAISSFKGGSLTNAGRAVTKHPEYFGFESTEALMKVYRSSSDLNNLGSSTLKSILRNGAKTVGAGGRYPNGWVTYTLPNGNAASWGLDGTFIGFRGIKQ